MEIKKLSFKKRTRARLEELQAKGIKKFCSYDVFGKSTTPLELDRLHTALYELCVAGEIERVKDVNGNFKKIRPGDAITPDWLRCKVMINQYVIVRLGDRSKMEQTNWARRQKSLKEKIEKKARVVSIWESIWPEMYQLPEFKKSKVSFTNQCMD
jgi:hypothetical protein